MFGALTEKGSLYIWGYDNVHPSGDSELSILTPIKSKFQTELKAISLGNAGGNDTQWLLGTGKDNQFYGGGYSAYGQAGTGVTATAAIKRGLDSLGELIQTEASIWSHISGGIRFDGTVVMWGLNNYGQLGDITVNSNPNLEPSITGGVSNRRLRLGNGRVGNKVYDASKGNRLPNIITVAENETVTVDLSTIKKGKGFNLASDLDAINPGKLTFKSMDESIATVNGGVITLNQNKRYGSTKSREIERASCRERV